MISRRAYDRLDDAGIDAFKSSTDGGTAGWMCRIEGMEWVKHVEYKDFDEDQKASSSEWSGHYAWWTCLQRVGFAPEENKESKEEESKSLNMAPWAVAARQRIKRDPDAELRAELDAEFDALIT